MKVKGDGIGLSLWGITLRMVIVYSATWFVNFATHKFGYRNFDSPDLSTDCWWGAIFFW